MYAVGHVALGFWAVADFSAHADMLVKPGGLQDSRWQKLSLVRQGFVCARIGLVAGRRCSSMV